MTDHPTSKELSVKVMMMKPVTITILPYLKAIIMLYQVEARMLDPPSIEDQDEHGSPRHEHTQPSTSCPIPGNV